MIYSTVLPIWQAIQERFHKTVKELPEQDLGLQIGSATIESLIRHSAEVEYMFADWFFGKSKPVEDNWSKGDDAALTTRKEELVELLTSSNENLLEAMRALPEDAWHKPVESSFGTSTPLEAIGRLMYHTGIHSGQISLIQKNARSKESPQTTV